MGTIDVNYTHNGYNIVHTMGTDCTQYVY